MSDMQMLVGNQIPMINSEVVCPGQCLYVGQLGVKEDEVEDVKTLSQYLYSACQQLIIYLVYNLYAI
jgi:hypothetical protein